MANEMMYITMNQCESSFVAPPSSKLVCFVAYPGNLDYALRKIETYRQWFNHHNQEKPINFSLISVSIGPAILPNSMFLFNVRHVDNLIKNEEVDIDNLSSNNLIVSKEG